MGAAGVAVERQVTALLTRADLDRCQWAVCGQTALAALLHLPLEDVRHAVPADHVWMTHAQMREALSRLGRKQRGTGYEAERGDTRTPPCRWPNRGLALIQFRGPWEEPQYPHVVCLKHTHWISVSSPAGMDELMVFDINTLAAGWNHGWAPRSWWERWVLARLIASHRRATGAWYVRAGIEVLP